MNLIARLVEGLIVKGGVRAVFRDQGRKALPGFKAAVAKGMSLEEAMKKWNTLEDVNKG